MNSLSKRQYFVVIQLVSIFLFLGMENVWAQTRVNICSRTQQVQDEIVRVINDPDQSPTPPSTPVTCATVTATQLAAITRLELNAPTPLTDGVPNDYIDITELQSGDFAGLTSLTFLNLSGNNLTTSKLPSNIFSGLSALRSLRLGGNDLTTLPVGIFSGLSALRSLRLDRNDLTTLPVGIFSGLSALRSLRLGGNDLTTLPVGIFSDLTDLPNLDLSFNSFNTLGAGVFNGLTNLTTLILRNTTLNTLEAGVFNGLTNLTSLNLNENRLRAEGLKAGVFNDLPNLRSLNLNGNLLTELPSDIFTGLTKLTTLSVTRNFLTELPSDIFAGLTNLTGLGLSENRLTELPSDIFARLTNLTALSLHTNSLTELPSDIFTALTKLRTLSLHTNSLKTLPAGIFSGLRLEGVDVSNNPRPNNPANDPSPSPLTLTVIPKLISDGVAVIEVSPGVPFIKVTADLTIHGGTDDMRAMDDVEIVRGKTQSASFAYTTDESSTAVITVSHLMSDPENILTGFNSTTLVGYSGFLLVPDPDSIFEEEDMITSGPVFRDKERINAFGESILPTVSRELISSMQNIVSERIGNLTPSTIAPPTAQVAGHSTLSDLLVFTAQTFDRVHNQDQSFAIETLLQETFFALPLNGEEGETSRTGFNSVAIWGSVDYQDVSLGDDLSWDGSLTNFHLGSDMKVTQEVLGGVALSWSRGMFDYEGSTGERSYEGEHDVELWSVHPYGKWTPLPWLNLWVIGGYGLGDVTIRDGAITESQSSDLQSYSGSFSVSAERDLEANSLFPGITTMRVKAQTSIGVMDLEGNGELISSLTTEAYQQRVSMEVSHTCGLICKGRYLIPTLEVGVRNDGGDGETGNGLEIGGDVEYRATDLGLRVLANGRWLAVHSGELEEWGIGGTIALQLCPGEGFWMSITPEWGETGSRARELWDAKIEDVERASQEREVRLGAEAGYGLDIGKASLTPSAGVSLTNQGYRSYRVGSGVIVGEFSLTLEGERQSTRSASEEESLTLEGSLRF